jgi:dolichol-phosphate mannosyltransferase
MSLAALVGSTAQKQRAGPELSVIIPTFNERDNVRALAERLKRALDGIEWEAVFVDDDSPDGTADEIRRIAIADRSIRVIQRIGRRGLAAACIEGMLSSSAKFLAIMDADLQHDESILPTMLGHLRTGVADLVVATRNGAGGSKGEFRKKRVLLSDLGAKLSRLICKAPLSDPMSGFFMLTRTCFLEVVRSLSGTGFKILVDIVSSAQRPLRVREVPYRFRLRQYGESKLDLRVTLEYLYLLLEKISHGMIPPRFTMFIVVGGTGIFVHLGLLMLLYGMLHTRFIIGQTTATAAAMTWNFFLNNSVTFRDARLHGRKLVKGFLVFCVICSFGALTNITVAQCAFRDSWPWVAAALTGIAVSSVWNYSVSSAFAWGRRSW